MNQAKSESRDSVKQVVSPKKSILRFDNSC